jgi:hypothetical protein
VGDDDLADGELMAQEDEEDLRYVGAGIDDDGLVRGFVAEDGAVAGERAYWKCFADHRGLTSWLQMLFSSKAKAQAGCLRFSEF